MDKAQKRVKSGHLAFWEGWASVFRPTNMVNFDLPDIDKAQERDTKAIASDWQQVGDDLRRAMSHIREVDEK